ncbi:MAG: alpha-galactosidase, partial [Clostridia bacterium]|nr:alpha-galactosidase [Clostridia bacterium]
ETLVLHLKDAINGFAADLFYTVYDDSDVIARHIIYKNEGSSPVTLQRAYSFTLSLPGHDYEALSLYGGWAKERHIDRVPLHHGVTSIDSKRCTSSTQLNPFLALLSPGTTEASGEAIGFSLVYSSSWTLKAQGCDSGDTIVTGGIQDFDFAWKLEAGESFATPEVVIAYSTEGLGGMSRAYHDAFREHLINKRYVKQHRPLLINNWEGTYFNFDCDKLKAIVDAVEGTGIDTFVLDDGWFGKRDNDRSGLGDWVVNETKMVGGLKTVIDHVHAKGMKFGLWFEPEMVSEDSDLYRAHPDYAIGVPGRPHCYGRHQLMLDLTRADVRDYIVGAVNKILDENEIDYVKWDYNRNVTEPYSLHLPADRQSEFAHRYALGLYDICERIVNGNPDIFFEGCSSGGARFDPAMLHYFSQIWTSDDSDAEERTFIQYGTSIVYPLSSMACHVSICPNHQTGRTVPFATRADIAHLGATGYELDTTTFTDEDRAAAAKQTEEYRACQDLILSGDLYRIDNPAEGNFFTEAVVAKDKSEAILVCYRRMGSVNNEIKRIRMQGLDPHKNYYVRELDRTLSGAALMNAGLVPKFAKGDFLSVKYHFEER